MAENYYKILGVEKKASKEQIKKAYKKLAFKFHPDKNQGNKQSEEKFKKINEAYAVLSNDDKRRQYDQFGAEDFSNRFSQEDIFRGFDLGQIFEEFGFGQDLFSNILGAGSPSGRKTPFSFDFGGGSFGQKANFGREGNQRPVRDAEMELQLTLEEAVRGGKKTIALNSGSGVDKIILTVPAGIEEGKKLKVKGKGTVDPISGRRGDLYCKISIIPHQIFKREGQDLIMDKEVKLTALVLGGSVNITTLDQKNIELKIPALTKNNSFLRVKGKGVPVSAGKKGNLLVRLSARLPLKVDEKQKELFKELAETDL